MTLNKHRLFVLVALVPIVALSVGTTFAQDKGGVRHACPYPFTKTLQASGASVNAADMPAGWNSHLHQGIGGTALNAWSGYSFDVKKQLPGQPCCQVTSATLTVTFKALQGGPCGSSTSANDAWSIMSNGHAVAAGVAPPAGAIYCPSSNPIATGYTTTKTVTFDQAVLNNILSGGFLSIYAEDDTEIVSASLVISGCCVNMR